MSNLKDRILDLPPQKEKKGKILLLLTGASIIMIALGMLFKILHWPFGSIILVAGSVSLIALSIIGYFSRQTQTLQDGLILITMITFISGFLFKNMLWPYAQQIMISAVVLFFVSMAVILFRSVANKS